MVNKELQNHVVKVRGEVLVKTSDLSTCSGALFVFTDLGIFRIVDGFLSFLPERFQHRFEWLKCLYVQDHL